MQRDVADSGAPPLTPVAACHGGLAAANMLGGNRLPTRAGAVPRVVFTIPPLAAVGMSAENVAGPDNSHLRVKVRHERTPSWYSSRRTGEECSGYKTLVDESTGRILGAHLLGDHAEEVINIFALAISSGLPADAVKNMLYAIPAAAPT